MRANKERGMVSVKLLLSNIRGYKSKCQSWQDILEKRDITIGLLNETNVKGKQKINNNNYKCFTKNNPNKMSNS